MYIKRDLGPKIQVYASQFPVVAILGPRQSGKTTMAREIFNKHTYVSLENLDIRIFAQEHPRDFLDTYKNERGIILDEFQNAPEILSYIQTYVDEAKQPGYFILTGSQNFLVSQTITQSLAGRVAIITLLPLALSEIENKLPAIDTLESLVFKGSYPQLYAQTIDHYMWYSSYVLTYLERDVRQIADIKDLATFQRFLKLCAGRVGQLLNIASLATDANISQPTAKAWLSLLQASYIIYLLQPHHKNFNKRLIKTPKLYFYDTGLACHLLEIAMEQQVMLHYMRGALIECFIISDFFKQSYNLGRQPSLYFWRDNHGNEVDCLIERALDLIPIEIKASKAINTRYFDGVHFWQELAGSEGTPGIVIYTGSENFNTEFGTLVSWKNSAHLIQNIDTFIKKD